MRFGSAALLVVALGLGAGAAGLARSYLTHRNGSAPERAITNRVVVATQALSFGTPLTEDNIAEIAWPAEAAIDGAATSKAEVLREGRRLALAPMQKNEPILLSKITGPGQKATLSTLIEPGMRAVAVRVDEVRGVAGFVLPGDRVDVVLTRDETGSGKDQGFADVLMQNVKVLGVDQAVGDQQGKPTVARAVTLELNTQQSQKIILAQGVGRLSLILRQAGESEEERVRRITVGDLGVSEAVEAKAGQSEGQEAALLQRVSELEARLRQEKSRQAKPLPAARESTVMINVVRNGSKREQYSVASEPR